MKRTRCDRTALCTDLDFVESSGDTSIVLDPATLRSLLDEAERDRAELRRLRGTCLHLAAPLTLATDGSTESAVQHITAYVESLEAAALEVPDVSRHRTVA